MTINMQKSAQDQMRKDHDKETNLAVAQREHDNAMRANPDQMKALRAFETAKANAELGLEEQIKQTEALLAQLKQQRGAIEPIEEEEEEKNAVGEREVKESDQSKHPTGKKFR